MTFKLDTGARTRAGAVTLGDMFEGLFGAEAPVRFSAYDGSTAGDPRATLGIRLTNPRGVSYLATAPGSLGLARAYLKGDLEVEGVHPGDPYELLRLVDDGLQPQRPPMSEALAWARTLGVRTFVPPPLPEQEIVPWQRRGLRHSRSRDAESISHHYDVSNTFYEHVLGPSMTYTCACYPGDGREPRAGAGAQVRPRRPQARAGAGDAAARRRLRLGRDGAPRRRQLRRPGARRDVVG